MGLVHYFEYFLERGILGAKHMRLLTLWLAEIAESYQDLAAHDMLF